MHRLLLFYSLKINKMKPILYKCIKSVDDKNGVKIARAIGLVFIF